MEAVKTKARVGPDGRLIWLEPVPALLEGEVEVILLYTRNGESKRKLSPEEWPILNGGRYLGGTLRREEIYDDAR